MKKRYLSLLVLVPLLTSCGGNNGQVAQFVDEDYTPVLPEFKNKNSGAIKEDDNYVYFDFYETSDFHGAVTYDKDAKELGIERLSKYFDEKRTANAGGTFVLSSGDMFQGTADSNVTRGNLVTYSMNVMNYDAMCLGNHEFDWSVKWLQNNINRATFPFLCANLQEKATSQIPSFVKPYTIIERKTANNTVYKVGIVGSIDEAVKDSILASAIADYKFVNEIETVKTYAQQMRSEGCDVIVWNTHHDVKDLKVKIASNTPDVDVIFGGHTHNTILEEFNGIPMLESKDLGRSIPHVQLKVSKADKTVEKVVAENDENPTSKDYSPDSDITGIFNQYKDRWINPVKNQGLGRADGDLRASEELPNFAVESMIKATQAHIAEHTEITQYDIKAAFTNISGGVRDDIKGGNVTYGDVYKAFPFDNEIVVCKTNGQKLNSLASAASSNNVAMYRTFTERFKNSDEVYFITSDYLATAEDKLMPFVKEIVYQSKLYIRDVVADAIRNKGTVKASEYKTSANIAFQNL